MFKDFVAGFRSVQPHERDRATRFVFNQVADKKLVVNTTIGAVRTARKGTVVVPDIDLSEFIED